MEELNPGGGARIHGPRRSSELTGIVRALPAAGAVAEYRHRAIKPILRDGLGQRVYDVLPYALEHSGGLREELKPGKFEDWARESVEHASPLVPGVAEAHPGAECQLSQQGLGDRDEASGARRVSARSDA